MKTDEFPPRARQRLAARVSLATAAARSDLERRPTLDLWPQPKLRTAVAEVAHRAGHIVVAVLVDAHGVAVREAEQFSNAICVKQFINIDLDTHKEKITAVLGSVRPLS